MALAMVEEDHGRKLADAVAAHLVLFARRPGFQSQFSEELVAQTLASDPLAPVISWMRANLRARLDVDTVARKAGMSVRSLHRSCLQALDLSPAKLVEKLRVEQARALLATTQLGTKIDRGSLRLRLDPAHVTCLPALTGGHSGRLPSDVLARLVACAEGHGRRIEPQLNVPRIPEGGTGAPPPSDGRRGSRQAFQCSRSGTTSMIVVLGPEMVPRVVTTRRVRT